MQLAYDRVGSGPALVLVHGIGSRRGVWKPVVPLLAAARDVLAVDLPGFGDSPVLEEVPTVEALAAALVAWWTELGLSRPHVVGNSLGGGIALELARMGAVASATALSPIGFQDGLDARWGVALLHASRFAVTRLRRPLLPLLRSRAGRAVAIGHMYGRPGRRDAAEVEMDVAALAEAPGWTTTLPVVGGYRFHGGDELRVPVTIGWGTRDRVLLPRQAERARSALPRARHVALPGCGHLPMSDDPEGVAALLLTASS